MKTAFIVDSDLGFGFWLARGLDHAGYQAFPSKTVADAIAMRDELACEVDLLIVNAALAESADWIETLRRSNDRLRVVALIGDQPRLPGIGARVDLCCRKPERLDDVKRGEWIEHVEELLPVSLFGGAFDNALLLRKCAGALVWRGTRTEPAAPVWKEWEGRTIDGRFQLERCLGGGTASAVFQTKHHGYNGQEPAAIRVVLSESVDREIVLPRWERAARLSHPGLVRLFDMGSSNSEGVGLSYVVMEYAEENLAEVLRQRPLTAAETRELLDPVLDALSYLHSRGLVHGRIKPSNILAVADQLKISSDGLRPAGEQTSAVVTGDLYDAPESTAGFISPAADVWSLGITLVEALTQRPVVPKNPQHNPPKLPVTLPPLFLDIAQQCLHPDPQRRETVEHLADRLRQAPALQEPPVKRRFPIRPWWYAVPAVALGIALSGVLVRPHQKQKPVSLPAPAAAKAPLAPVPSPPPAPEPAPLVRHATEQVLPEVSDTARSTIQGTLEVRVQVRVDRSGSVVSAKLDSGGPSRYFANRALDAARRWKFNSMPNQSDPEDWMLRFDYTKAGTNASGERVSP